MFCSLRGRATPRVVGVRGMLYESRSGQQRQAHGAAADSATLKTRKTAGATQKANTGRRIAARRPLGRRHDGVGAVGGLTADPDTTGSSGQLETLAEGRGGRATGHCSARRYRGRGGELRRSRCAMMLRAGGGEVSQTLVYEGCLIERRHMFVAVSYLVMCPSLHVGAAEGVVICAGTG